MLSVSLTAWAIVAGLKALTVCIAICYAIYSGRGIRIKAGGAEAVVQAKEARPRRRRKR